MVDILKQFGNRIKKLRSEKNISQEELALIANLHRTYIGMIERGEKNLTLTSIQKLSRALEIDLSNIFKGLE
ncbi:helix-turn-helix transcriptional regulator [Francisella philomiragia]|uniref:Helix-turn-helix transcriptional regulator n=1 Tax=Francisella philomiragia TaxID=28110 RepID=A0ABS1G955_9GAMM|nr:helix-turn-helix transcriptional regulator [Francisella philomiragia]MBK2301345.1 helix-turn-helix transcriptional regulator [Francisella philomiragia]QIW10566.1 helix-turn-helix transcriptional regulator [Francisella sp. LA112445]